MRALRKNPEMAAVGPANPYFSKVIEKSLRILNLFTPETTSLSLKDITLKTRINSTSTFRFVETFIQLGYLKKDPKSKLIKLGPMALALGYNVIESFDMLRIVKPYIDEAFETFNITIDSGIVEDGKLVNLYRREAKDTLVFKMPLLDPRPLLHRLGKGLPLEASRRRVLSHSRRPDVHIPDTALADQPGRRTRRSSKDAREGIFHQ